MTQDPRRSSSPVGYKRPPVEHRFKKGVSGNPAGRPAKAKSPTPPASSGGTELDDILLAEALRPIQVRENDRVVELPMIQAVLRSLGVSAVKGHHRAQLALAHMVRTVQEQQHASRMELFKTASEYKEQWEEAFSEADQRGVPRPDPVPHPSDIVLDMKRVEVRFNGPLTQEEKAKWDRLLRARQDHLEEARLLEAEMTAAEAPCKLLEEDIAHARYIADMLGGIIPDERTRRMPGFDLERWREEKGTLKTLQAKRARKGRVRSRPRRGGS